MKMKNTNQKEAVSHERLNQHFQHLEHLTLALDFIVSHIYETAIDDIDFQLHATLAVITEQLKSLQ